MDRDSYALTLGKLLIGGYGATKKDIDRIFSSRGRIKVGVVGGGKEHGRCVLKNVVIKVYGFRTRIILDSGRAPNVRSKDFVDGLVIEPNKKIRCITDETGEK